MRYSVEILEEAFSELESISDYYEKFKKGLGENFIEDWERTLLAILKTPLGFVLFDKHFRLIQFQKFPFLVIYELRKEKIIVYRIIHIKRNPEKRIKGIRGHNL